MELDITSFDCEDVGANTVTLTVTDVNDNQSTATATVTVVDGVDPVASTQDVTVQLDASGNGAISVSSASCAYRLPCRDELDKAGL